MIIAPFSFHYAHRGLDTAAGISVTTPLVLPKNGVVWVTGDSGSGKSTLLHLLKGFYPEFLHGELIGNYPQLTTNSVYLTQNPITQSVHERVGEEYVLGMELSHTPRAQMPSQLRAQCLLLSPSEPLLPAETPCAQLSHGQAQRVLIGSMLAAMAEPADTRVLLLDEPTAFLDAAMRADFYTLLAKLKQNHCVIVVDHHAQISSLADVCWFVAKNGDVRSLSLDQFHTQNQIAWQAFRTAESRHRFNIPALDTRFDLHLSQWEVAHPKQPALFTADVDLASGQCAVIRGANGVGKSSFFNSLAGVIPARSGSFQLRAAHTDTTTKTPLILSHKRAIKAQMMYVFQHPDSHFFFDTVGEELAQLGVTEIDDTLTQFGLAGCAHRSPHQLSEGQKRRLTLLFPILQRRPIILLDEPSFGQDAFNTQRIIELILQFKQAGYTLLLISHDETLCAAVADVVWQITQGRLTACPPDFSSTQNDTENTSNQPHRALETTSSSPTQVFADMHPSAAVTAHRLHDAHVLTMVLLFFILIALPLPWWLVLTWSGFFALLARYIGVSWLTILQYGAIAMLLSWSVWLWNVWLVATPNAEQHLHAIHVFLRVSAMTWVALLSGKMLHLRDVVQTALQRKKISLNIGYALNIGLGAIELLRTEARRITLSAHLRNLKAHQKIALWLPLMVFALRHATRSTMSLRARGLTAHTRSKSFYFDYQPTSAQRRRASIAVLLWLGLSSLAFMLARALN